MDVHTEPVQRGARHMPDADGTVRVLSVSLGSSSRDHLARAEFLGRSVILERRGTDGDISRAIALVRELDGRVDAFGMGGIDLYLRAGRRRYRIRDAVPIARAARITPMVDGSGLKDTLERRVIAYLVNEYGLQMRGKTVLMVSAMDRFGMAEALEQAGCRLILGDLMFGLGIPVPLYTLRSLELLARVLAPVVVQLPFRMLYPTGERQKQRRPRFASYYERADIIAGDYHFIAHHMPDRLPGKIIITNTVTAADLETLRARGVSLLVTTTPEFDGRSFGTNVMEAVMVALSGRRPEELTPRDYEDMLDRLGFRPRIQRLSADAAHRAAQTTCGDEGGQGALAALAAASAFSTASRASLATTRGTGFPSRVTDQVPSPITGRPNFKAKAISDRVP